MNRLPLTAVECKSWDEHEAAGPGAFYFANDSSLINNCPGCGRRSALTIGGDNHPQWTIVYREPLTLSPSVNCVGCCGWHGYLKNGVWTHV